MPCRHTPTAEVTDKLLHCPDQRHSLLPENDARANHARMIVTLTTNATGHQRIYLGGVASVEAWIEKADDGRHWTFHMTDAVGGSRLSDGDKRATAIHLLMQLSDLLDCAPDDLAHVPFQVIASLHNSNPREHRRVATPRRDILEHAYLATAPNMRRPRGDFTREHYEQFRRNR